MVVRIIFFGVLIVLIFSLLHEYSSKEVETKKEVEISTVQKQSKDEAIQNKTEITSKRTASNSLNDITTNKVQKIEKKVVKYKGWERAKNMKITNDSLIKILTKIGICIGQNKEEWVEKKPTASPGWYYYFCDLDYFKIHPLLNDNDSLFIVEVSINIGASIMSDNDNFVVCKKGKEYKVLHFFKADMDTTFKGKSTVFDAICWVHDDWRTSLRILGKWKKDGFYTDRILDIVCIDTTGFPFDRKVVFNRYSNKKKWDF